MATIYYFPNPGGQPTSGDKTIGIGDFFITALSAPLLGVQGTGPIKGTAWPSYTGDGTTAKPYIPGLNKSAAPTPPAVKATVAIPSQSVNYNQNLMKL